MGRLTPSSHLPQALLLLPGLTLLLLLALLLRLSLLLLWLLAPLLLPLSPLLLWLLSPPLLPLSPLLLPLPLSLVSRQTTLRTAILLVCVVSSPALA